MKKVLIAALIVLMGNILWCNLQEHYKKGKIVLKATEEFGQNSDWEDYAFISNSDIVVAPTGSVFISKKKGHHVLKFDKQGNSLKKFGRKGRGPGDLYLPGNLTVLDNKHLIVGEFASSRRFSLWDLNGNYIKVVKTKRDLFVPTALKNGKMAYLSYRGAPKKQNGYKTTTLVIIKDIDNGNEKIIRKVTMKDRSEIILGKGMSTDLGNFFGEVFIAQTIAGNLMVGISNQPTITIYSPGGKKIHSFQLNIKPMVVDNKYLKEFRDKVLEDLKKRGERVMNRTEKYWYEVDKKAFKSYDFSTIFDKYLPLYKEILVDGEGNFLIFKFTECQTDCDPIFQVYSKEGKFICETTLDRGIYDVKIDRRFRKLCFTKDGIFGLVMEKGDEDEILKLIKSNY